MLEEYPLVLLPDEACEVLRIGKNELYSLLNSNKLKGYRVGKGKNSMFCPLYEKRISYKV